MSHQILSNVLLIFKSFDYFVVDFAAKHFQKIFYQLNTSEVLHDSADAVQMMLTALHSTYA